MFGKLKEKLTGMTGKLSGNTDLLEMIAAGSILVAAADGDIDTNEIAVLVESLVGHETIGKAFSATQIERTVDKMVALASPNAAGKIGAVGKMKLEKEIREARAKSSTEELEMALAIMVDVAGADDDGVEAAEKAVINKISSSLGLGQFL